MCSLWSVLGKPEEFPFYYVQVLIERLKQGSVETVKKVKEALDGDEPLFTYKDKRRLAKRDSCWQSSCDGVLQFL